MDPRVRDHAEIIVDHSVSIEPGDNVIVVAAPEAEDLVVALHEKLGKRGALPMLEWQSSRADRAFMRAVDAEDVALWEHSLAAMEAADAYISIRGESNTNESSDIPSDVRAARSRANKPIFEASVEKRWVGTQYPAPASAQLAEMSTEAYEDFVYDAVNKDWDAQREFQSQLVELLEPASEVRVVSGDTTDLWMSLEGMTVANDYGERNLPGGEVYTGPVPDSVEGEVTFDMPVMVQGSEVRDAWLRFEDGTVVDHAATKNEDVLTGVLDTDDGARRLGELGIGMNRDIDRFTRNMLFDEKMGDTVHMAVGRTIDETIGEDREGNDSAVHLDMILDVSEDAYIEVDGDVIQRNGTFVFEDEFEA